MSDKESASAAPAARAAACRYDTSTLIELVRARGCLWDRTSPHYRQRVEKERAWLEVYRALEPHYDLMTRNQRLDFGQVVNRKWANIRDSYKKYLNGSHRVTSGRPYLYADLLTFLDATYDKDNKGKIYYNNRQDHEPDEQEWFNEVFVDMDARGGTPEPKRMRTDFPRTRDNFEAEESIVSVLVNLMEKEEDEDRAFFKSITPTVKSLSESDKFLFRIKVMKLLDSLKRKDNITLPKKEVTSRESDTE